MQEPELVVTSDGNRLDAGIVIPDEPRGLALLLHGVPSIAPTEPGDAGYAGLAQTFAARGWAGAWVDMRGARSSPGYFSIDGWVRDATVALEAAESLAPGLTTVIVGSSAGGCVAAEAIRRGAPADGLALLASPASWVSFGGHPEVGVRRITREAGMKVAPEVEADPTEWAAEFERVTAENSIAEVNVPVLILHGDADIVVPVSHAQRIADRAPDAELHIIPNGPHQLRKSPEALDLLFGWLEGLL